LKAIRAQVKAANSEKQQSRESAQRLREPPRAGREPNLPPPSVRAAPPPSAREIVRAPDKEDLGEKKKDGMSDLGEMESLRLQMSMDRLSKLMSTLSNILKKTSDTQQQIIQNLK
ncbi:MAG: hypothetical protein ACREB3_17470, partial [Burkholderiales bacterium]